MIKEQAIIVNKPNQIKKTIRTWKQKSTKRKKNKITDLSSKPTQHGISKLEREKMTQINLSKHAKSANWFIRLR